MDHRPGSKPSTPSRWYLILGLLILYVFLGLQISTLNQQRPVETRGQREDAQAIRIFSSGFLAASIDWIWIQALQNESAPTLPPKAHAPLYDTLDLLTDLDPAFFFAYYAGGTLLAISQRDGTGAEALLLKGLKFDHQSLPSYPELFKKQYWSEAWILDQLLGYTYLFELGDIPRASLAIRNAANRPSVPLYVVQLAELFDRPHGIDEVRNRLRFLEKKTKFKLRGSN